MKTKTIVISIMIMRALATMIMTMKKMLLKIHTRPDNPQTIFKTREIITRIPMGAAILGTIQSPKILGIRTILTSSKIIISTVSTLPRSK